MRRCRREPRRRLQRRPSNRAYFGGFWTWSDQDHLTSRQARRLQRCRPCTRSRTRPPFGRCGASVGRKRRRSGPGRGKASRTSGLAPRSRSKLNTIRPSISIFERWPMIIRTRQQNSILPSCGWNKPRRRSHPHKQMGTQAAGPTQSTSIGKLEEIRDEASGPGRGPLASLPRLFGRPAYPVDAYWYRAQFVIAATAANAALKKDPTALSADQRARDAWHRAREQAGSLVIGVERALLTGVRGELRTFLQELEPSALILLAGTFIAGDRQEMQISGDLADERDRVLNMTQSKQVNGDFLINMATSLRMSPRAHYNIACYYSSKEIGRAH